MKYSTVLYSILLLLFLGLGGVVAHRTDLAKKAKNSIVTPQQKATHFIKMLDKEKGSIGYCTATAIGKHALITAEHCVIEGNEKAYFLNVDMSTRNYKILAVGGDGRDHVILLLDGPSFTNLLSVSEPKSTAVGTPVYMYGDGGREYPARKLEGKITNCTDPSDVDADQGMVCFSLPVIGGDSGSLVYDAAGNVVAIITYGYKNDDGSKTAIGFKLDFDSEAIEFAKEFDPAALAGLF